VVLGQRTKERASLGQLGARLTKRELQPGLQTVASIVHRQSHGVAETNIDRADMESLKLESKRIKEKLSWEKGKPDFEEQLRELDVEISSKADIRCNVENIFKAWALESEMKVSANKKEDRGGEDSTHGLGCRLHRSGPHGVLGRTKADDGLVELKNPLAQVMEPQLFQVGTKVLGATE